MRVRSRLYDDRSKRLQDERKEPQAKIFMQLLAPGNTKKCILPFEPPKGTSPADTLTLVQ